MTETAKTLCHLVQGLLLLAITCYVVVSFNPALDRSTVVVAS